MDSSLAAVNMRCGSSFGRDLKMSSFGVGLGGSLTVGGSKIFGSCLSFFSGFCLMIEVVVGI